MQTGRVIKTYNSFFYVETETGMATCRMRGKFKKGESIYPGDFVEIQMLADGTAVIEHLLPRKNLLQRPVVANIDQVVLTFAAVQPDLHPLLLNRFLVLAEWSGIAEIVICVNKIDLLSDAPESFLSLYEKIGYPVIRTSAKQEIGISLLKEQLKGKITVFAGPSGVGKSSLLNCLDPSLSLETGRISNKIKRGRHTTRVAQLLPYENGYVVDTPGFSSMDLEAIEKVRLADCFPEFADYIDGCHFVPCSHSHEPKCGIKDAVMAGHIAQERYDAYRTILQEIEERKEWSWK